MSFERGDIVIIEKHFIDHVVGRCAEVTTGPFFPEQSGYPAALMHETAPGEPWYVLIDVAGERRAAAHSWLRRVPDAWVPRQHSERERNG